MLDVQNNRSSASIKVVSNRKYTLFVNFGKETRSVAFLRNSIDTADLSGIEVNPIWKSTENISLPQSSKKSIE